MTFQMLQPLTADEKRRHGHEPVVLHHRLADTGLFTDEALAALIDRHPRHLIEVLTMKRNPPADERWIAGEAKGMSGAELMEAVRRGRLWINLRQGMSADPEYKAVFDPLMAEFAKATGARPLKSKAGILISSPRCGIFYHCDSTETMLWHVRGTKTIYLYAPDDTHLPEQAYEAAILGETLNDLPYSPSFEGTADPVVLEPGMAATWPLHGPHRVVNHDSLNVSVSIEYTTVHSMLTNGVFFTNGIARRRLGHKPRSRAVPAVLKPVYWAVSKVLQRMVKLENAPRNHARAFDVDLRAPDCIAWRPGLEPAEPMDRAA